jgi:hypothetical protein
LAYQL